MDTQKAHWSKNAAVYEIYPMSFKDSNGDGYGDLAGILEKIDHLNGSENSLGIDAVWICPFFKSPMRDWGYDVTDYTDINPMFGDMKTFEKLVEEFHARGIKIIIDYVGNHTSDQHEWFKESRSSRKNKKRDWYIWHDGITVNGERLPPNNWVSIFGGSVWEYDKHTDQYYLHTFLKEQPDLNWHNPEVREAMGQVIDFWVKKGVDGLRIDAFYNFIEDKLLRDDTINPTYANPHDGSYWTLKHNHSLATTANLGVVADFTKEALARHPNLLIVAEAYVSPQDMHAFHELIDNERFTVFNFTILGRQFKVSVYKPLIDEYLLGTPDNSDPTKRPGPKFLPNFTLGNHDMSRLVSQIGEAQARVAVFLQFMLPGLKFIYYGDEIGMTDTHIPEENIRDWAARLIFKQQKSRDPERTPMQWDDSEYAGFSSHKPWLPINDNYKTVNVAHNDRDPKSMLSLYKSLIRFYHGHDFLHSSQYVPRDSVSENVFSFELININTPGKRFIVYANFGDTIERELLPEDASSPTIIFCTSDRTSTHGLPKYLELLPYEGYVLEI